MGLTKQYLRYAPTNVFGVVSGTRANIKVLRSRVPAETGKFVACGACEFVFIWDLKKGEIVMKLASEKASEVTSIEQDATNPDNLAVGYLDGSLRMFNLRQRPSYMYDKSGQLRLENETVSSVLTFFGHKTSVTCLDFDSNGVRLASGSKDTDIVIWDLVGECGLFRLKGHKSPITSVLFLKKRNILISSSKDMLVKFWDLDTKHCFKTIVLHRSEITDMLVLNDDTRLLTGCQDNEIRVFELTFKDGEKLDETLNKTEPNLKKIKPGQKGDDDELKEMFDDLNLSASSSILDCNLIGSLVRESKDSLAQLNVDNSLSLFSSHSANEKHVEIYKINNADDIKKRLAKKLKKTKRKLNNGEEAEGDDTQMVSIEQTVSDEFARVCMIKSKHKIKFVDMYTVIKKSEKGQKDKMECKVACLLQNNQIEVYLLDSDLLSSQGSQEAKLILTLDQAGHRTDVRTLSFNSDSSLFLSASGDSLKVWNRMSLNCIKTFKSDYAVCSLFLSDDNHILIGTKSGKIQLFNISMGRMLENVLAHDDDTCVWSMCLMPDKSGFVSGGADKNVRFWAFELVDDEESKKKRLTFVSTRTLKFDDDVLCVKISPNNRLIAVSLLDSTVKVFFMDSLKLFLNMYGHKQPVLSMDISFDNKLIVTGSADRHIKIWGMDFGDCHRSIFAHEDSVMGVQFVGKTHYVFSVGKDGKLNEWDADKFERIITLDGHLNEIWALGVSHDGKYVLTSSHDKSIRIWEKTNEPLVLEDERETEKEKQYEEEVVKEEQSVSGVTNSETGLATIKTIETIKSAERMIESLQIYLEEKSKYDAYVLARDNAQPGEKDKIQPEPKHPMLMAMNLEADDHVLETLKKTKSSEIETMLTILEFEHVKVLLELLCSFLNQKKEVELCVRCIMFLLKINIGQITLTETFLPTIKLLKDTCFNQVSSIQNVINFNLAAAQFYRHKLEEMDEIYSFPTLGSKETSGKKSKKNVYLFKLNSASKN